MKQRALLHNQLAVPMNLPLKVIHYQQQNTCTSYIPYKKYMHATVHKTFISYKLNQFYNINLHTHNCRYFLYIVFEFIHLYFQFIYSTNSTYLQLNLANWGEWFTCMYRQWTSLWMDTTVTTKTVCPLYEVALISNVYYGMRTSVLDRVYVHCSECPL